MTDNDTPQLLQRLRTFYQQCTQTAYDAGEKALVLLKRISERMPARLHRVFRVLRRAYITYIDKRATQASASLAYYALFSLFPLLLVLISLGSVFLKTEDVQTQIVSLVVELIPTAGDLVAQNIQQVLESRGAVSIAAVLSLLWSATGFFVGLMRNVERAWDGVKRRSIIRSRLVAVVGIVALGLVLYLMMMGSTILNLISGLNIPGIDQLKEMSPLWKALFSRVLQIIILVLAMASLYHWVPRQRPTWTAVLTSTVLVSAAIFGTTVIYRWYLNSGLSRYSLVYGSLGTIIGLMVWIYTCCIIILFGAHLCSAIDRELNLRPATQHPAEIEKANSSI